MAEVATSVEWCAGFISPFVYAVESSDMWMRTDANNSSLRFRKIPTVFTEHVHPSRLHRHEGSPHRPDIPRRQCSNVHRRGQIHIRRISTSNNRSAKITTLITSFYRLSVFVLCWLPKAILVRRGSNAVIRRLGFEFAFCLG